MEQNSVDATFIKKTGKRISAIIIQDPDNIEWINEVADYQEANNKFQDDVLPELIKRLSGSDNSDKEEIIESINKVCSNKANINDFLLEVFFAEEDEEEEEKDPGKKEEGKIKTYDGEIKIQSTHDNVVVESELDPTAYFDYQVTKLADILKVHHDLAYLLLNYFFWDTDLIIKEWADETKRQEILTALRVRPEINYGLDSNSPFAMKNLGVGECPICCEDEELFQLYCGHTLCKNCIVSEIQKQLESGASPVCRDSFGKGELCNAQLIDKSTLKSMLNDNLYQLYTNSFLNNEIIRNHKVKACPYPDCGWIITPANRCPCNIGKCHHCESVVCLLSDHEAHAPLRQ